MVKIDGWEYYPQHQIISKKSLNFSESAEEYPLLKWDHLRFSLGPVQGLGVIPTLNCRNRCRYCITSATEGHKDLDLDVFKTVLRDFAARYICYAASQDHGVDPFKVSITGGGEPTLNWNLFRSIVDYSREYTDKLGVSCEITVTTNATGLTAQQLEYLAKNLNGIMISYDGTTEIHNRNRPSVNGPNAEEVEGVIRLLSKKRRITLNTVVVPDDLGKLRAMMDKIATFEIDNISWIINPVITAGRGRNVITVSDTSFYDAYIDLKSYAESRYGFDRISTPSIRLKPVNVFCDAIDGSPSHLWLCSDGYLRTCVDCPLDPVGAVIDGRICLEDDYSDMLVKTYQECRASEVCMKCVAFPVCKGGCPAEKINGDKIGHSVTCRTLRSAWLDVIKQLIAGKEPGGWFLTPVQDSVDTYKVEFRERDTPKEEERIVTLPALHPFDISVHETKVTIIAGTDTEAGAVLKDPKGMTYYIPGFRIPSDACNQD